jgi:hypothetical protein
LQKDGSLLFEHADKDAPPEMVSELTKPILGKSMLARREGISVLARRK